MKTTIRLVLCATVLSVIALALLLQTSSAQGPPEAGHMQSGVVRAHGGMATAPPNRPLPESMGGQIPGMPGGPMGMSGGGMGPMGGPQFAPPMGMAGGMGGPMHGGMSGAMSMGGGMGMAMHGVGPAMPHPPVDSDTLGLCVKAMLLNFRYGSVELIAPLFKLLPPEAQRHFLTQALEIAGEIDFDSFDAERRETLGADADMACEAAFYRQMIDKREQRARMQVTILASLAASLLVPPQFAQPPVPHAIPGQPFAHPPHTQSMSGAEVGMVRARIIIQEEEEEFAPSKNSVDDN